jgi:hypothetical protein
MRSPRRAARNRCVLKCKRIRSSSIPTRVAPDEKATPEGHTTAGKSERFDLSRSPAFLRLASPRLRTRRSAAADPPLAMRATRRRPPRARLCSTIAQMLPTAALLSIAASFEIFRRASGTPDDCQTWCVA